MTYFTEAETKRIRRLATLYDGGRWKIIEVVYRKLRDHEGGRMEIYKEASLATRFDDQSKPLVSSRQIRDWMRLINGVPSDYLLYVKRNVLNFEHLEVDYQLHKAGLIEKRGDAIRWALDEPNIADASVMDAHFRNVEGETEDEYRARKMRTAIGALRQCFEDAPPEVTEALDVLEGYVK